VNVRRRESNFVPIRRRLRCFASWHISQRWVPDSGAVSVALLLFLGNGQLVDSDLGTVPRNMLQAKPYVPVDYRNCHPERCDKGVRAAVVECPNKLWKQEEPYDSQHPILGFYQEPGKCVDSCR